jgi:tetratricopeptide (TPR) repeat protein
VTAASCFAAALALWWVTRGAAPGEAVSGRWLLGWGLVLALYAVPQLQALVKLGVSSVGYEDAPTQLRSLGAIFARYLAMAATSYGTSVFHEPEPVRSWTDPWWLAAWPLVALLGGRLAYALATRREEAMYWALAAAAYAPVAQVVPTPFGMADRYLYFVLPGLLGGALLWWRELRATRGRLARLEPALQIGAAVLVVLFAGRTEGRAALWQSEARMLGDAASQYPNGATAHFVRAGQAAQAGRHAEALVELRSVVDRRHYMVRDIPGDPALAPLRELPEFQELAREIYRRQIEHARAHGYDTQLQLRYRASAHAGLGEYEEAERVLEDALRRGGPLYEELIRDLDLVRELRKRQASQPPPDAPERPAALPRPAPGPDPHPEPTR